MDDKEPVPEVGPRLTKDPLDEEEESKKPVNRTARNLGNLIVGVGFGGLFELAFPNQSDSIAPDVCYSFNIGICYFFVDRFLFYRKDYPAKYSLEDSFYLAAGTMLGKSMVKAARNITYNAF
ncbi:hypothetical protein KY340_04640 [Candidatus Woesearchaeota archaeon]|nr:hypothetical protein [Candidatus Woesearchaeota archaeon]